MKINQIPEDAVLIKDTLDDYIDPRGIVYGYDKRNGHKYEPFIREQQINFGYKIVKINYPDGTHKNKRVHRLVAEAFIPNPDNLPIVMHINNDKTDNRVENLKWGTISENTKQAFDDGLEINDKSWDDSQSMACSMYDGLTNKLIKHFGSYSEAMRETGINKSTIAREVKEQYQNLRKRFYFQPYGQGPRDHYIIMQADMDDNELNRFISVGKASEETNTPTRTISGQIKDGKPSWTKTNFYFKKVLLKGEEIIEI